MWRGLARRKNLRVWIQNVPVCTGTTRTCVTTCGRGAGTHGDVLNLHTEVFWDGHTGERRGEEREGEEREGRGSPSVLLTKKSPRRVLTWPHKFTERNPWILPIRSFRIDREQLVPESSNHSLYLMNLFIFSNLEESAHTTNTNTNTKTQTPTQQTQTPTQHTHTHQHILTNPPTSLSSPPSPLPPPRTRARKRTCTCTCILCMCVYVCVYVYVHVYVFVKCKCKCKCECKCKCKCKCVKVYVYAHMYMFSTFHNGFMSFCYISYIYIHLTYIYICYHQSSRKPPHSKWNCVGTNRPRHIHMNTPKIRILQKNFRANKFEFESSN